MTQGNLDISILFVYLCGLLVLFPAHGFSANTVVSSTSLQGPAFSKPFENHEIVSVDWVQKKIQYPDKHRGADLLITLDQNIYPVFKPFIDQYARKNTLRIDIIQGTCGITAGLLVRKQVDMGGFCCPPAVSDRLPDLVFHTVGITPVAFVVPVDNPINNITIDEARQMYRGNITNWSELSDPAAKSINKPIVLISRMHCKLRPGHWRSILDNEDLFSPLVNDLGSIEDVLMQTVRLKGIGYVAAWIADQEENKKHLKMLRINGIHPEDKQALAQNRYPFYRVLNMTSWKGQAAQPESGKLIHSILDGLDQVKSADNFFISTNQLRANNWQFHDDELIGEPDND